MAFPSRGPSRLREGGKKKKNTIGESIMARIAFIGLGNMGGGMAANLAKAGHDVRAFDLSADALAAAKAAGCLPVDSAIAAMDGVEAVVTMLPAGNHVERVYPDAVFAAAPPSAILIDCSTIDVATARRVAEAAQGKGMMAVDAPVSGGIAAAKAGTLTFMVGGPQEAFARAEPFLSAMGQAVIHAGGHGAGQAAKICNNMMLFIDLMASAEGSQLAEALGLDPEVFWQIASVSSGRSWAQQTWYPVPGIIDTAAANNNFEATFRTDLARKDIGLALDAGASTGVQLPAASLAREHFDELIEQGLGDKDCSLIVKNLLPEGGVRGWNPESAEANQPTAG